jgi:hypothetical protein
MLKLLACLFMLLDHIGFYFQNSMPYPLYIILRCIGRLAFPIFAWSVARGCARTRNPFQYFLRMCLFAIPTEVLFRILNAWIGQAWPRLLYPTNVLITFTLAIVLVFGYQMATRAGRDMIASLRPVSATQSTVPTTPRFDVRINIGGIELDSRLGLALGLVMMAMAVIATLWLEPDYSIYGILTVLLFFAVHDILPEKDWGKRAIQSFFLLNLVFLVIQAATYGFAHSLGSVMQCLSVAALPICYWLSREKKPGPVAKYAFYLFYPLHVTILVILRMLIP